jgi:hypothetical protein
MKEKVIPNIPRKTVVVSDNAPYLCIQVDKPTTYYAVDCHDFVETGDYLCCQYEEISVL